MKINIQFKVPDEIEVDLTKFGCSTMVEWDDLTIEKQLTVIREIKEKYKPILTIIKKYPIQF